MLAKKYIVINPFIARTATGDVQLHAGATIQLPEKSALQLLEIGKIKAFENEIEEIKPVSQETLNAIFEEVSEKLSLIYKSGEFEYCRTHHPELYQAERDALNYVDSIWFDALVGRVSLEVFKQAVNKWYDLVNTHIEVKK